jgi:hypothetical protein
MGTATLSTSAASTTCQSQANASVYIADQGKISLHPHLSSGFERATRIAEGFHSDIRGPFSVPTPQGFEYLLTLIDDKSDRIFPYLLKSQTEWLDIWSKFVVRIEVEMGRPNCIYSTASLRSG